MGQQKKIPFIGELLAEFVGTMVLIAIGDGGVAMVVLFGKEIPGEVVNGGYTNIILGWGLGVMMGICVAGPVSGGHLNPAVTLAAAVFRGFPAWKVLPYCFVQVAGGFAGAGLVFFNYLPAFMHFDPDLHKQATTGILCTFPAYPEYWASGFFDLFIGTAFLVGFIWAITDPRNRPIAAGLIPILVGAVVMAIGISWGGMHGYAINPARDLGPRLFTLAAGFKSTGFGTHAAWVPVVAPLLGGLLGALIYDCSIRPFLPWTEETVKRE
jgi:glycerol uptake facilitator